MTGALASATRERRRLQVLGVVQGVGFRPFVYRLATGRGLGGFVLNQGGGVVIEVEGPPSALDEFVRELHTSSPPLARIERIESSRVHPAAEQEFSILPSRAVAAPTLIPPDIATCDDCLRELFDPADRRYRYPFINCTDCGPRFTIVRSAPYDRRNTTMADFDMCAACHREYENPADRRFHAEPIACPACGPRLSMPLEEAIGILQDGGIIAVKGLGGYHLACDARDEAVVARLRARKRREEKPFALMTSEPERLARVDPSEKELLGSPRRPVVLVRRRDDAEVAPSVAPGTPWLGLMLPYTPLHHLLAADFGAPLVMTSGNRSDEPIAVGDREARERLGGIADGFLSHDRPIHRRCEDSVVRSSFPIRRSRGWAPEPVPLPVAASVPLVATGAELKSTFCVATAKAAYISPHLGDLDNPMSLEAFANDLALYLEMLSVEPELIAHDLHPDYLSTRWASAQQAEPVGVQHHHAHAASCLAEHGRDEAAIALVFDGTGYGPDGTLWGGEILRFDLREFERLGHLEAVPLPGGEAAIQEPWRMAAAYLERAGRPVPFDRWGVVRESLKVNAPLSSGAGRLFDAVAALLGLRREVSYEGQAAIELEHLAGRCPADPYPCRVIGGVLRGADLIAAADDDRREGRPPAEIAAAFHEGLAAASTAACAELADREANRTVVLSGGTMQNLRLTGSLRHRLERIGFEVLTHRRLPPNDAGISYGQAAIAARRMI